MKKAKTTKRALLSSVLALILCMSMFVGTTFAWFTDSVTSANNIITSGNLDVDLEYKTDWADAWADVDSTTKVFDENALYEPGYTETVFLRVSNAGSLALKYQLMVKVLGETEGTNVAGEKFKLSDYLQIGTYVQDEYSSGANYADILFPSMFGTREAALSNVASTLTKLSAYNGVIDDNSPLLAGDQTAKVIALVLTMPETVSNEANYKTGTAAPEIELGLTLLATQYTDEKDSFGNDYDKDALYPVINADDLIEAVKEGKDVKLEADITLPETIIEVTDEVIIDLNNNNLDASANTSRPFELADGASLTINGTDEEVTCGTYGLVNIPAGNDATVVINGGTYNANTNAGSFIKPRGDGEIKIVLNEVNYTDTSANGYALDCTAYTGDNLTVEINGGSFESTIGLILPEGSTVTGTKITVNNTKNMQPAIYATGDMTIENCIIKAEKSHAVAVANGATLTVKNCEVYAGSDANALAFQVFSSGGTINVINTTFTGGYGSSGKMNAGKVGIINIDGVQKWIKQG